MNPPGGAFDRLRALLRDVEPPADLDPVALHLGESRLGTPAIDPAALADAEGWARYPRPGGTAELRAAYTDWLGRRFGAAGLLAAGGIAVEPTPGSRQAAAAAIMLAAARKRGGGGEPAVAIPNPFYPTYRAGVRAAGARPLYYTTPGLPVVEAAGDAVAAIVLCSPGNPLGEILSPEVLRTAAGHAAEAGAVLIVDECYTDLFLGRAPAGYLSVVAEDGAAPGPFLVLHTLSKRSAAPGLRSGFVAGDPSTVAAYADFNRTCGVSLSQPVCTAAARLWADDAHVAELRAALARNWEIADATLGRMPGYRRAGAGFFLWLPVPDDEAAARDLWRRHALMVMPGRYLAAEGADGADPGAGHLRIALVHEERTMRKALLRLRNALDEKERAA